MRTLVITAALLGCPAALAQDVPGIEICTAEQTMIRRTSCLQSNINFLQATITKEASVAKRNLDAALKEIESLKAGLLELQKTIAAMPPAEKKAPAPQ